MNQRQGGFTLIEILVVITIIAALVGLVTLLIPEGEEARKKAQCMNNLRQIGGLIVTRQSSGKQVMNYSGAPFLLQVANNIKDTGLEVFICPGESGVQGRPETGTQDFIDMYRKNEKNLMKLDEDALSKMSSYAGANWAEHKYNPASNESRIWGCDACMGRIPYHRGIVVLWDSNKVNFIDVDSLEGQREDQIVVGPGSGDKRLEKMIFLPKQR